MAALRVARISAKAAPGPGPSWSDLYRAGGIAGLLAGLIYIVAAILIFATPSVPISGGAETLLYIAAQRSLYILKQILWLAPSVLMMVVFLALYPALKHLNKSYAAIGAALGFSGLGA